VIFKQEDEDRKREKVTLFTSWFVQASDRKRALVRFAEEQHDMARASSLSEPATPIPQYAFKHSSGSSVVMV
jgi:hypothetical protein